jgi:hypothetical protein
MYYLIQFTRPATFKLIENPDKMPEFASDYDLILTTSSVEELQKQYQRLITQFETLHHQAVEAEKKFLEEPTLLHAYCQLCTRINAFLAGYLIILNNFHKFQLDGEFRNEATNAALMSSVSALDVEITKLRNLTQADQGAEPMLTLDPGSDAVLDQLLVLKIILQYIQADTLRHAGETIKAFPLWQVANAAMKIQNQLTTANPFWLGDKLSPLFTLITVKLYLANQFSEAQPIDYIICLNEGIATQFEITNTFALIHGTHITDNPRDLNPWLEAESLRLHTLLANTPNLHYSIRTTDDSHQRLQSLHSALNYILSDYLITLAQARQALDGSPNALDTENYDKVRNWLDQASQLFDYEPLAPALSDINRALSPCFAIMHLLTLRFCPEQDPQALEALFLKYADFQAAQSYETTLCEIPTAPVILTFIRSLKREAILALSKAANTCGLTGYGGLEAIYLDTWDNNADKISKQIGFSASRLVNEATYFSLELLPQLSAIRSQYYKTATRALVGICLTTHDGDCYSSQFQDPSDDNLRRHRSFTVNLLAALGILDLAYRRQQAHWALEVKTQFHHFYAYLRALYVGNLLIHSHASNTDVEHIPLLRLCLSTLPVITTPEEITVFSALVASQVAVHTRYQSAGNDEASALLRTLSEKLSNKVPTHLQENTRAQVLFYAASKIFYLTTSAQAKPLFLQVAALTTANPFYTLFSEVKLAHLGTLDSRADQTALVEKCLRLADFLTPDPDTLTHESFLITYATMLLWGKVKGLSGTLLPEVRRQFASIDARITPHLVEAFNRHGVRFHYIKTEPDFFELQQGEPRLTHPELFYRELHRIVTLTETSELQALKEEQVNAENARAATSKFKLTDHYLATQLQNISLSRQLRYLTDTELACRADPKKQKDLIKKLLPAIEAILQDQQNRYSTGPLDEDIVCFQIIVLLHLAKLKLLIAKSDYPAALAEAHAITYLLHDYNQYIKSSPLLMRYTPERMTAELVFDNENSQTQVNWCNYIIDRSLSLCLEKIIPEDSKALELLHFRHHLTPQQALPALPSRVGDLKALLVHCETLTQKVSQQMTLKKQRSPECTALLSELGAAATRALAVKYLLDNANLCNAEFKLCLTIIGFSHFTLQCAKSEFRSPIPPLPFKHWYQQYLALPTLKISVEETRGSIFLALLALEQRLREEKPSTPQITVETFKKSFKQHLDALPVAHRINAEHLCHLHIAALFIQYERRDSALAIYRSLEQISSKNPSATYSLFAKLKLTLLENTDSISAKLENAIDIFAQELERTTLCHQPEFSDSILLGLFDLLETLKPKLRPESSKRLAEGLRWHHLFLTQPLQYQNEKRALTDDMMRSPIKTPQKTKKNGPKVPPKKPLANQARLFTAESETNPMDTAPTLQATTPEEATTTLSRSDSVELFIPTQIYSSDEETEGQTTELPVNGRNH